MDPERREALRDNAGGRDTQAARERGQGRRRHAPLAGRRASGVRHDGPDPAAAGLEAARPARLRPRRDLPLHQPGDALYAPSGAAATSSTALAARRSQGAKELQRGGRGGRRGDARARRYQRASAAYRFFPGAFRRRPHVMIYSADGKTVLESLHLRPPEPTSPASALPITSRPRSSGRTDYLCMFVTTIGAGVRALAEEWKDQRRVPALAHPANPRAGGSRGVRRAAASEDPPDVGLRRSAGDHDEGPAIRRTITASASRSDIRPVRGWRTRNKLFRLLEVEKHRSACS